jgi:hypothetical protein
VRHSPSLSSVHGKSGCYNVTVPLNLNANLL